MKRIINRIAATLLTASLLLPLAACGEASLLDAKNPVTITLWHYYIGSQLSAFDDMVREFNQTVGREQGIQVESLSHGGVNELAQAVLDSADGAVGGGMPDIFAAYPDTVYPLKERGLTADLSAYMTQTELAEYVESFWQEGCLPPDGVATIFPTAKSTELLLLDAVAWNEFVQEVPRVSDENLQTWEGIAEACEAYYDHTREDGEGSGRALFGIDSPANFLYVAMRQQGVTLLTNEGGQAVLHLDEEPLRRAFELYYGSVAKGWFGHVGRFRSDDVKTGEIIGFIGASTSGVYFPDIITSQDGSRREASLGAYPMPTFQEGERVAIQQGAGMVVSKSEEKREYASMVFLKWLTQQEQNLHFSTSSAYLPVKKEALYGAEMDTLLTQMEADEDIGQHNTAVVFRVVLDQLETHELFFTDPFEGLYELRKVLESLEDYSAQAREEVLERIEAGESYGDAVQAVVNEEAFQTWLSQVAMQAQPYLG